MATQAANPPRHSKLTLLLMPLGLRGLSIAGAAIVLAGASYCFLRGLIIARTPTLAFTTAWAAFTLLPWLLAFEANKRILRGAAGKRLRVMLVGAVMAATVAASGAIQWLLFAPTSMPLSKLGALHIISHLPEVLIIVLLTVLGSYVSAGKQIPEAAHDTCPDDLSELLWAKAAGNYVELKIGERQYVRRMTLKQIEAAVDAKQFARISRSVIVNRRCITARSNGRRIRLADGSEHAIGNAYRSAL